MGAALEDEVDLLWAGQLRPSCGPPDGPDFLFGGEAQLSLEWRGMDVAQAVDMCLLGQDECGSRYISPRGPSRPPIDFMEQAGGYSSPDVDGVGAQHDVDDPPALSHSATAVTTPHDGQAATTSATMPTADFVASFKKPLLPPVIHSPPRLRTTRATGVRSGGMDDSELVPKRSARLEAKSKNRLHQPEA